MIEAWRRLALYLFLFGAVGVAVELWLLGHFEDSLQWTPIALLVAGICTTALVAARPSRASVHAMRALMLAYVAAGAVGLYFHIRANVEFELELRPSMAGGELVMESLMGAIPALAPGAMAQLGLLGLLATLNHPSLDTRSREGASP